MKVDFYVIDLPYADPGEAKYRVEFNFENESLRHSVKYTMRKNMFEKWIDRILENKVKVKSIIHLGTEFEYTRTVDENGKIVDPFLPKFDLTKVKDLTKEVAKS